MKRKTDTTQQHSLTTVQSKRLHPLQAVASMKNTPTLLHKHSATMQILTQKETESRATAQGEKEQLTGGAWRK